MKYLQTKYEKDAAKITLLITVIIVLLLFVVGRSYMDPPEEFGVAVNFGTSNTGSGKVQPKVTDVTDIIIPKESSKPSNSNPNENSNIAENIVSDDASDEYLRIEKEKAEAAKQKQLEEDLKAKEILEKQLAEQKKKKEEQDKINKLNQLMGGIKSTDSNNSSGEGDNTSSKGDKGQLDGNPYAASYFGASGNGSGGVGYGLNGRGVPSKKIFKQECNEYGLVVVRIEVNKLGNVVSATPGVKGSTNTAACLLEPAKKIASSHKWPSDDNAPVRQIGFVSINFTLN